MCSLMADITYNVALSAASSDVLYAGKTSAVSVVNDDNDTPELSVSAISGATTESGGTATFSVALTVPPTHNVAVTVVSGDTGEGSVSTSTIFFTTGNWSTAQTVTVTGADDFLDDDNVTYSVSLQALSADPAYHLKTDAVAVVNTDDDTAGISVTSLTGATTEAGSTATFYCQTDFGTYCDGNPVAERRCNGG